MLAGMAQGIMMMIMTMTVLKAMMMIMVMMMRRKKDDFLSRRGTGQLRKLGSTPHHNCGFIIIIIIIDNPLPFP